MLRESTSCMVQVSPSLGLNLNAYIVLPQKPHRQLQKIKSLQKYLQKYSSGWKKHLELADLLYETGQWSEAIVEYYLVINKQPQSINPYLKLGNILQLTNQEKEAIPVYSEAINIAQKEATKQHLTGLIESCQDDFQAAIVALKSAITLEPENLAHWMALGQIQMEAEYILAALATFDRILFLDPDNLMGLIYSYDLLLASGNYTEAEKHLCRAMEIAPLDIQTLKRLIMNRCQKKLVEGKEGKQTKKLINLLSKKASKTPEVNNLLAKFYILRGEHTKGINLSHQFVLENPRHPSAWYYYSRCLFESEQYQAAADAIMQAYQLSLEGYCDREIYRALCEILPLAGRLDNIRKIMIEMLEMFPGSLSLRNASERVLSDYFPETALDDNSLKLNN